MQVYYTDRGLRDETGKFVLALVHDGQPGYQVVGATPRWEEAKAWAKFGNDKLDVTELDVRRVVAASMRMQNQPEDGVLTPYDTGQILEPVVWNLTDPVSGKKQVDRYGRVDFENEEGGTEVTVWVEATGDPTGYLVHVINQAGHEVEVSEEM